MHENAQKGTIEKTVTLGAPQQRPVRDALAHVLAEASGACGDLGTFLPYVVLVLVAGLAAPAPVFAGFAVAYLMVALVYRLPIAVQPMKAFGVAILTGAVAGVEIAWGGALLGVLLVGFACTPHLVRAARAIPQSVVTGLQAGLGLLLGALAFRMIGGQWLLGAAAVAVLALSFVLPRGPWALLLVVAAVAFGPLLGDGLAAPGLALLAAGGAAGATVQAPSLLDAVTFGVLPQLPLTLLNAVVVAAAVARSLHGEAARHVGERRLAATSGLVNLVMAPLGALPMCHGAGGISGHHRFGARGMLAPLLLAGLCAAAALSGDAVVELLARIPAPVAGALLLYAAWDLAFSRRLFDARPDCRPVIAATALGTFGLGVLPGFAAGLAAEAVRARLSARRRASR
ncbi:putative sulfate/molybdate transporter [Stappia sp. WLB 29]|uniref:putative sulfate/molybdate transporter n=1 Tax=Stappia sp. WLB 29 TaxID=2925220 RepID=UPI0020BFD3EF|nr:putative sulfate/molybdate transporter [Stappia sp. WLB 29]